MPNRRPDPARGRQWRKRLARWKASSLKVRAFCEWEGVTPTAFAHWRKEIATRYTEAGFLAVDNNASERALRAVGRKNCCSPGVTPAGGRPVLGRRHLPAIGAHP